MKIIYNAATKEINYVELTEDEKKQEFEQTPLPKPTLEEKVAEHDTKIVTLNETIDVLYGGV